MSSKTAIARCIKESGNWSKLEATHKFDNPKFDPKTVAKDIDNRAPKLKALIEKIKELDDADMKKHGKLFKHFIYSDVKSAYGAKLIASALSAHGFEHAYQLGKGERGTSFKINTKSKPDRTFATLTSVLFFEKPIGVRFRKELLSIFNARPDNINGAQIRIIILDSGFREGIDLFDVKYVHLFEPIITRADQKQAIGRATRFCGQKGLQFEKNIGWPLYVFRYETIIPKKITRHLLAQNAALAPADAYFELFMKFTNIDPKKIAFANELEPVVIFGAVDRFLTRHVHNFEMEGLTQNEQFNEIFSGGDPKPRHPLSAFTKMQQRIRKEFSASEYNWPPTKIENGCVVAAKALAAVLDPNLSNLPNLPTQPTVIDLSPTQNFVRKYFTPASEHKGLLLMHSVGTGKTCSAIAVGSSSFEQEGYTIIYVTRHTLKADVWKNMFGQTCSMIIQDMIKKGVPIPEAEAKRAKLIKAWMEPMSYKQFSNALQGKNSLYEELVTRNGKKDPLRKTLIIVDEAHKLYAPDVAGSEKPDIAAIKTALLHSYKTSASQSAKLLIMTATPYTDDPMDMIKLLNLMRPEESQLPDTFDAFQTEYLNEIGGFSPEGRKRFLDEITGCISYLNRERDVRSFSYPIIKDIRIPLSEYEFSQDLAKYLELKEDFNHSQYLLSTQQNYITDQLDKKRNTLSKTLHDEMQIKIADYKDCLENYKEHKQALMKELAAKTKSERLACKELQSECEAIKKAENAALVTKVKEDKKVKSLACKTDKAEELKAILADLKFDSKVDLKVAKTADEKEVVREVLKQDIADTKARFKEEETECKKEVANQTKNALLNLKEDLKFDLKECEEQESVKKCLGNVAEAHKARVEEISSNDLCDQKNAAMKQYEIDRKKEIDQTLKNLFKSEEEALEFDRRALEKKQEEMLAMKYSIDASSKTDNSQQIRLEHCLKTQQIKPLYKQILSNKTNTHMLEEGSHNSDNSDNSINNKIESNVYLINGHGSERPTKFEQRKVLPDDKILIVFPLCGRPNWMHHACHFMDIFNDPKYSKWLMDPIRYKAQLQGILKFPIRVYLPGDRIPTMSTNIFFNFEKSKTVLLKSGVYEMANVPPINRDRLPEVTERVLNLGTDKCLKYIGGIRNPTHYTPKVHKELFKGDVFQSKHKPYDSQTDYHKLHTRHIAVDEIMELTGPGIYYYTGCRSMDQVDYEKYEKLLERSASQQNRKHARPSPIMQKFKEQHLRYGVNKEDSKKSKSPQSLPEKPSKPSNPNTPPRSPSNPPNPPNPPKPTQQNKDILKIQRSINLSLTQLPSISTESRLQLAQEWKKKLEELGVEEKDSTHKALDDLIILLTDKELPYDKRLVVSKKGNIYTVNEARDYKIRNTKYTIIETYIGVIPVGAKDRTNKCTTTSLLFRLKKAYKKGTFDSQTFKMAKIIKDYEDPQTFEDLCKEVRSLRILP